MEEERPETRDEAAPDNEVKNAETIADEIHTCPYRGCQKTRPTWKGFLNHCYTKHKWSAL